jgi:hypothetical protein
VYKHVVGEGGPNSLKRRYLPTIRYAEGAVNDKVIDRTELDTIQRNTGLLCVV